MSATPNTELNKIIARYWLEFISTGNIEAICSITAPEWKMHGGLPGLPAGPEGVRKLFRSFGNTRQQWKLDAIIAEGDKVVARATNICLQDSLFRSSCLWSQANFFRNVYSSDRGRQSTGNMA